MVGLFRQGFHGSVCTLKLPRALEQKYSNARRCPNSKTSLCRGVGSVGRFSRLPIGVSKVLQRLDPVTEAETNDFLKS